MIRIMIFDLDGKLVQTERLKAISYARAAVELWPDTLGKSEVVEVFKDDAFDFIATRYDMENSKPDPEIYQLGADELATGPAECLMIEDSPFGVKVALAAGMNVIAVATPFTHRRLHEAALLPPDIVADDPVISPNVVRKVLEGQREEAVGREAQPVR